MSKPGRCDQARSAATCCDGGPLGWVHAQDPWRRQTRPAFTRHRHCRSNVSGAALRSGHRSMPSSSQVRHEFP